MQNGNSFPIILEFSSYLWHDQDMSISSFKERTLMGFLGDAVKHHPALVVTGPRGSGKTTFIKELFGKSHSYCPLDYPAVRRQAQSDPQMLLTRYPAPVILDEIQSAPALLPYIEEDLKKTPKGANRYIITGSQIFPLMDGVTDSLLERVVMTTLLPMSFREVAGDSELDLSWSGILSRNNDNPSSPSPLTTSKSILRGGFPEPALNPDIDLRSWHSNYIQTYLERDSRALRSVMDPADFERFVFALAARCSQLINLQEMARDLGITGKTVRSWIEVLEASGQVFVLRHFPLNLGKRVSKRPKVYFLDTGTLAFLMNVTMTDQVLSGIAAEPLFEAAVFGQILRLFVHGVRPGGIHFWQTAAGHKVDFIVEENSKLIPIEAKLTSTPTYRDAAPIMSFQRDFGSRATKGLVVCLCRKRIPLTKSVDAIPLSYL